MYIYYRHCQKVKIRHLGKYIFISCTCTVRKYVNTGLIVFFKALNRSDRSLRALISLAMSYCLINVCSIQLSIRAYDIQWPYNTKETMGQSLTVLMWCRILWWFNWYICMNTGILSKQKMIKICVYTWKIAPYIQIPVVWIILDFCHLIVLIDVHTM